jgi:hypothetical protein
MICLRFRWLVSFGTSLILVDRDSSVRTQATWPLPFLICFKDVK